MKAQQNEEINSRINLRNTCCHSLHSLFSSGLLSKNLKIKVNQIIISAYVMFGCETWSFNLRKERKLGVLVNRVIRIIFEPKREEVAED
jgi:hypothetical protein